MSFNELQKILDSGLKLTPMMEQYFQIKKNYQDTILLFRMGDFYEVFFEDAKLTSQILNITLTHRGKLGENPIPMAGIPHHAASTYIDKITQKGIKVAICEQIENPKDAVGIVKRAVTQVVSPGIPFDLDKSEHQENKYIISTYQKNQNFYLAALDFITGEFKGFKFKNIEDLNEEIKILNPKEFVTFMGQWDDSLVSQLIQNLGILKTHLSIEYFSAKFTDTYIEKLIPGYKRDKTLKSEEEIFSAIGALSYYIYSTQSLDQFIHIKPFQLISKTGKMKVSLPTLTGLEILPRTRENYKDSLLGFFDKTQTAMGSRRLKYLFSNPLSDLKEINHRLDVIEQLTKNEEIIQEQREELSKVRDIEKILAKISLNKCTASDLINLAKSIKSYSTLLEISAKLNTVSPLSKKDLITLNSIAMEILNTLNEEIGASLEKGNLILVGVNKERDKLSRLHLNVSEEILNMETALRAQSGILKLRIKSNNVTGFFIEVSKGSTTKVPKNFERRQTLVNAERYTTPELTQLEKDTITAQSKLEKLEKEIFKNLVEKIANNANHLISIAEHMAELDCFQSFAILALSEGLSKPVIEKQKKILHIENGFHPLIRSIIKNQFICHDIHLDEKTFFGLITGPNMAGKTTVMREVAIIQFLAQIGSFVPAKLAHLGIKDFLFSRLGASDDILKGQSTFMVEMSETAEIIRHASENSLIILDEIGRGTSTYDGLSLAWGLLEHFVQKTKAITLFATHYHELIDVVNNFTEAKNLTVETFSQNGNVQFLYRLIEAPASQSYGIYVAKLAGLPDSILKRAEEILFDLENEKSQPKLAIEKTETLNHNRPQFTLNPQLCFLDEVVKDETPSFLLSLEKEFSKIDISKITPLDALIKLNLLKNKFELR